MTLLLLNILQNLLLIGTCILAFTGVLGLTVVLLSALRELIKGPKL